MKGFLPFLRTTLVGGLLFLAPIIVVAVVGRALEISNTVVAPLAARIPVHSIGGIGAPKLLAAGTVVFFCFLAGFFARTAIAKRIVAGLESRLLSNLPGYDFIKGVVGSLLGVETEPAHPVVLAWLENSWQIAFLIERIDGGHAAVFVPGAPSPWSGSVYFMSVDAIRMADIPGTAALKCVRRLGAGSNALLGEFVRAPGPSQ